MEEKYYTAKEAAVVLGLAYRTFLARVRRGHYEMHRFSDLYLFERAYIDSQSKIEEAHVTDISPVA